MGMFFDRRCPYCNAVISDSANKCRHCGEWLISEKEKKQLDKNIQESKKLKEQAEGFIVLCIIIVLILFAIFIAIDGIKNTFFNTSETDSVQENVIEQKGDVINMDEDNPNSTVKENQPQKQEPKTVQQAVQSKLQPQSAVQHKQPVSTQNKVVVPQAKPVQTQQNQEINDFMY